MQTEENKDNIGWGCVANINVWDEIIEVVFLTPTEMSDFKTAYRKVKDTLK